MASVVVWDIVRRESAFLRKSNGIELSSEPLNVTGANSYKFSGLSQPKALGVIVQTVKGKGDKIKALIKTSSAGKSPAKGAATVALTHGRPRAAKALNAAAYNYRSDLNRAALAKYAALAAGAAKKVKQNGVVPTKKARRAVKKTA